MNLGDKITSNGQPLFPGLPLGYNGTDFDILRSAPDNADALTVVSGGQSGALLRTLAEGMAFNGTQWDRLRSAADNADAVTTAGSGLLRVFGQNALYNGATFDRWRANLDNITLQTLSAQTTSSQTTDQTNFNHRGVKLFLNITAITGTTPTIVFNVQVKDPVSGVYTTVLSTTTLNATGMTVLTVYPGITATSNVSISDILTRTWRVSYTIGGTTPAVTATIAAVYIL